MPAINSAAMHGNTKKLTKLLDAGVPIDERMEMNYGTLALATAFNRPEAVKLLLARGANPNWENALGLSALSYAQTREVVDILVAAGAEVRKTDIDTARKRRNHDIANYLELVQLKQGRGPHAGSAAPVAAAAPAPKPAAPAPRQPLSDVASPGYKLAERPDDLAIVIGIDSYSRLPSATHAERDAEAMRAHLKALGLPERNIIMLKGADAGRGRLAAYFEEWLPRNVKPTSRVFIYYSGHGAPDPKTGQAYMVPWDGDPMFLQSTAYPLSSLYSQLGKLKAKHVTVALDACFSGAGGRSVLAKGARPLVTKTETTAGRKGLTVLAAASGDEITGGLDEKGHGMFTYFLLKGLSDGKRTAGELHGYLKPRVQDEARRQNREQTPQLIGEDAPL